jgi:peptide/nickel transport system permease protein
VVTFFVLLALAAPWLAPHDPLATSWSAVRHAPSGAYLFGADELGRDVLSRIIWGTRASILAGVVSVSISLALGVPIGMLAGYLGRWVDALISRVTDAMLACPFLILAIAMAAFLGPSLTNAMIAIGISATPVFIRLTRAQVLAAKSEDYVEAARALGNPHLRIALRHIFPNIVAPLIVQATLAIAAAVIAEASLSFLGLGQQPPAPSWGSMLKPRATTSTRRRGWRSGRACRSSCSCSRSTCSATGCATRSTRAHTSRDYFFLPAVA